jgi:hypothetical protein
MQCPNCSAELANELLTLAVNDFASLAAIRLTLAIV